MTGTEGIVVSDVRAIKRLLLKQPQENQKLYELEKALLRKQEERKQVNQQRKNYQILLNKTQALQDKIDKEIKDITTEQLNEVMKFARKVLEI